MKITETLKAVKKQGTNLPKRYFIPKAALQATLNS